MALIRTGNGVAQISGSIAGTVFARNRGGAIARNRVKPLNPRSNAQANVRSRLGINSASWRNLTESQRLSWNGWAATHPVVNRLGDSVILSGAQAYGKINNNRVGAGDPATPSLTPGDPAFVNGIIDTNESLTIDVSSSLVQLPLGDNAAEGQILAIYMTPLLSPGIANAQVYLRLLHVYTLTEADITAGSVNFSADWINVFGSLAGAVGKSIVARIAQYDEGQYAVPVQLSGIGIA